MRFALLLFSIVLSCATSTKAADVYATGLTRAEVLAAIVAADEGDTVILPAGTATWSGAAADNTIAVTKTLNIHGTGYSDNGTPNDRTDDTWETTINNGISSGTGRRLFTFGGGATVKMRYIAFGNDGGSVDGSNHGAFIFGVDSISVLDSCKFQLGGIGVVQSYGYGVISNCYAYCTGTARVLRNLSGNVAGGGNYGDPAWANPVDWGSGNFVFMEDNYLSHSNDYSVHDGWNGGRSVIRHNVIKGARIVNHGTESSGRLRSMRAMEIYGNLFDNTSNKGLTYYIDIRGGPALIYDNTIIGRDLIDVVFNAYRRHSKFTPWGPADGTMLWDAALTDDGAETPGGAGDGVYDGGTVTSAGVNTITDAGKSWTTNQWVGYTLRVTYPHTATGGGLGSVVVSGAGWTPGQWNNWSITNTQTNEKGNVSGNTDSTLTLHTNYFRPSFTAGDDFVLSRAGRVVSNTDVTITVSNDFQGNSQNFADATAYELRKLDWVLDGPGRGQTTFLAPNPTFSPNHQNLSQGIDGLYLWNNTDNGGPIEVSNNTGGQVKLGREYFEEELEGYTPYTYPHPLRAVGPDETAPTLVSAMVNAATLTLTFSETVTGGAAEQWSLSSGSLSGWSGSGATRTMAVTPPAEHGESYTLSYTPGDIEDAAENALAEISARDVTNVTPAPEPPPTPSVRNAGSPARAQRVLTP